jgi:radical SAM superfamily enzyme YgiQ (UPF0313 family)
MRLLLVNPSNPLVSIVKVGASRWNRFRVWQPLGLMALAGLTPPEWESTIADENLGVPDYAAMPRPDLVGITAFTSQASRAYAVAAHFRRRGVPVVMGGIHATMCLDEVEGRVDSVVTGEAEGVWHQVLEDVRAGRLQRRYQGGLARIEDLRPARHDLLPPEYAFGSIQTTRGCPLNCSFCSVTAFNGTSYRQRPIADVVRELAAITAKRVLVVDDNLIGTRTDHVARAKALFRAIAQADLRKEWIAQTTINFADDDELLDLAVRAGCQGVFIGFETPTPAGLRELGKKFNLVRGRDFPASVRRIHQHGMMVLGSFIIGLDADGPGIGRRIAEVATEYGVDNLNTLFLTPLPGTQLWDKLRAERRVPLDEFPQDWGYYTLTYPVARYRQLSLDEVIAEMDACDRTFYSIPNILRRAAMSVWQRRGPLIGLVTSFSYRSNMSVNRRAYAEFKRARGHRFEPGGGVEDGRPVAAEPGPAAERCAHPGRRRRPAREVPARPADSAALPACAGPLAASTGAVPPGVEA